MSIGLLFTLGNSEVGNLAPLTKPGAMRPAGKVCIA